MGDKNNTYNSGKIYIIRNTQNGRTYIGSTIQPVSKRMTTHRRQAKLKENTGSGSKLYNEMNEIGVQHFNIYLLEDCPCQNIDELHQKETELKMKLKPELNIQIPYTDLSKTDRAKLYQRKFYLNHKDQILEQCKEYRDNNKEEIKKYHHNRYLEKKQEIDERNNIWREANQDRIREKARENYQKNKERICARKRECYQHNKEYINERRRAKYQGKYYNETKKYY